MKFLILIAITLLGNEAFSQSLICQAVYYNPQKEPFRIQRKYLSESKEIYVYLSNSRSYYLQDSFYFSGDTTIMEETLYEIVRLNNLDKHTDLIGYVYSPDSLKQTQTLSLYDSEYKQLGDTTLPYEADFDIYELRNSRVPRILSNEIKVPLDSLIYREKTRTYFLNGIPVIVDSYSRDGTFQSSIKCQAFNDGMICRNVKKDLDKLISVDSIKWNSDTSRLEWIKTVAVWDNTKYYRDFHFISNTLISHSQKQNDTTEYLAKNPAAADLIIEDLLYFDNSAAFELKYPFNGPKTLKEKVFDHIITREFRFNDQGQTIEECIFKDGKLVSTIWYEYF